ncbi:MAG TPA: homoserine dehydrogenase, partial [Alphaproteobacteria bacterium]|nr:homoserine dehydrogenase [Alphaproteobacteria bacterium]
MSGVLRIGLAGLGTVGAEVARLLQAEAGLLEKRAGRKITFTTISARDRKKPRGADLSSAAWLDNPAALASRVDVDAVVELIGGAEGPALELAEATLKAGKPFITANKALLAQHGPQLAALAAKHNAPLYFEAAVAGGIPVIKTLREALAGGRVREVFGILNGTCNYILSSMRETRRAFPEILKEAQAHGYAEANPDFDVNGNDTAHKLAILSALAFGSPLPAKMDVEGIRSITLDDIRFA